MNQIKSEYLSLLNLLNKTNKTKNEKTQLSFFVDDRNKQHLKLYATLSKDQKILMSEKKLTSGWLSSGITQFTLLESYIAKTANNYKLENFTESILAGIFELPD